MPNNHPKRWEYAKQATRRLQGWKLRAAESAVVAVGVYFALPYFGYEAKSKMIALAISTGAALIVFPLLEFAGNYLNADRALDSIELDQLRTEKRLREGAAGLDDDPTRVRLREDASEIIERLGQLRWTETDAVINGSYMGRWVSGEGKVKSIAARGKGYIVRVADKYHNTIELNLESEKRPSVEPLNEKDAVRFDGCIKEISKASMTLSPASVRLI